MGAVEDGKASPWGEVLGLVGCKAQTLQQEPACLGPVVGVIDTIVGLRLQHYALDDCVHDIDQQTCTGGAWIMRIDCSVVYA